MEYLIADTILYNANVLTMNKACPEKQLVAIKNDRVLDVAGNDAINNLSGERTRIIDCQGKTILPGFNDAHCHLLAFAENLLMPDIGPSTVHSIAGIQDEIRKLCRNLPSGSWIKIRGYNEFYLDEKRHPTRWDIDKATTDHPVKLTHRSGHAHVLNSLALEIVGISGETPEPPGGMIERDLETGKPNGVLYGMNDYLAKIIPLLSDKDLEHSVELASEKLISMGITSIQEASHQNDECRWQMFQRWKKQGRFKPGINMILGMESFNNFQKHGFSLRMGDNHLRLGGIKIILNETRGQLNPPQKELNQKVLDIHQAGFQVVIHAVEETTIEAACSAIEHALNRIPRADHRHRIEHCSVCTSEMAKRLASLGIIVVTQPSFIYYNGERYLETIPEKEINHLYPIATLIKCGVKVASSSDFPIVSPDPIIGIYAAVSRKSAREQILTPEECISSSEALRIYTEGSAYACFEETIKGSIVPGQLADLVVLNDDPTKVTSEEIKDLEVEMTIIGGEIVWRKIT